MDIRKLKTILDLFEKSDVHVLELNEEGESLRLTKKPEVIPRSQAAQLAPVIEQAPVQMEVSKATSKPVTPEPAAEPDDKLYEITSPMVGTFYSHPSPDEPQFVKVGDHVTEGEPVCVIEAMKLFNNVNAPVSGRIVSIEAENGQPVGYGDRLMTIKIS